MRCAAREQQRALPRALQVLHRIAEELRRQAVVDLAGRLDRAPAIGDDHAIAHRFGRKAMARADVEPENLAGQMERLARRPSLLNLQVRTTPLRTLWKGVSCYVNFGVGAKCRTWPPCAEPLALRRSEKSGTVLCMAERAVLIVENPLSAQFEREVSMGAPLTTGLAWCSARAPPGKSGSLLRDFELRRCEPRRRVTLRCAGSSGCSRPGRCPSTAFRERAGRRRRPRAREDRRSHGW